MPSTQKNVQYAERFFLLLLQYSKPNVKAHLSKPEAPGSAHFVPFLVMSQVQYVSMKAPCILIDEKVVQGEDIDHYPCASPTVCTKNQCYPLYTSCGIRYRIYSIWRFIDERVFDRAAELMSICPLIRRLIICSDHGPIRLLR